jgi:ubiquinone/menaquinone biosynthesis C-methylase UbiE
MMASNLEQVQPILRCPISKQGVRLLLPQELALLNTRIKNNELVHANNTPVKTSLDAGLISNDGLFVYPVLEGIILLIETLAIPLDNKRSVAQINLGAEKKILQDFYDSIGWQKEDSNKTSFIDALKWEDLRPVANEYIHNCHLRVNRYINDKGQYLLDAGSGPIQYPDYLTYSEGYDFRICVDISFLALKEAQKKIGGAGIYILGDVTNIPLRDNVVDGAISLHVIYHVPKDEQVSALLELHRVLKPSSSAAIVYSWPKSQLMERWLFPRRINREFRRMIQITRSLVKKVLGRKNPSKVERKVSVPETPYHYAHDQAYFENNLKGLDFDVVVWRSVSVPFLRMYIHPKLFGAAILRAIYRKEENDPARYGRIGQYPLFVIRKK